MGYGDELMAAGHAQRVFDADPSKHVAICDLYGRVRWDPLWDGNPIIAKPYQVQAGEPVHRIQNAMGCRPYIQYPFTRQSGSTFTAWRAADHLGRLYLTAQEQANGERVRKALGRFVVIEPSPISKSNPNKAWGFERFEKLVKANHSQRFVQFKHPDARIVPSVTAVPVQTFREACGVLASSAGYVGPEGGLHHASAVLGVPAVVIFGGCASVTTTGYPTHINLVDDGPGTPCGKWTPCDHCQVAMARITVDRVTRAMRRMLDESLERTG